MSKLTTTMEGTPTTWIPEIRVCSSFNEAFWKFVVALWRGFGWERQGSRVSKEGGTGVGTLRKGGEKKRERTSVHERWRGAWRVSPSWWFKETAFFFNNLLKDFISIPSRTASWRTDIFLFSPFLSLLHSLKYEEGYVPWTTQFPSKPPKKITKQKRK